MFCAMLEKSLEYPSTSMHAYVLPGQRPQDLHKEQSFFSTELAMMCEVGWNSHKEHVEAEMDSISEIENSQLFLAKRIQLLKLQICLRR